MKIAIVGYGKMGKTIERLAQKEGHEIVLKTNEMPRHSDLADSEAQVAIEFSQPEAAYRNIETLLRSGIPVVSGTTGWLDKLDDIKSKTEQYNGSFLYASNFSLGVNLFFEIVKKTARLMKNQAQYQLKLEEIHHTQKKDAPSGTAISIAEKIMLETAYDKWSLDEYQKGAIPIFAKREEDVPGTHSVEYQSEVDKIELVHTAYSREGFALGAIKAAEYIHDKKGVFRMKDVLGL